MSASPETLLELRDVDFGYGDRLVLSNLNMRFTRGQVVAVMGGSGCGKTTVLRLIGGLVKANRGQVLFGGEDVGTQTRDGLYALRRKMGMLFQFGALFTDQSVFENVAFPLREHTDLPEALLRDLVLMKLNAVGLRGARDLAPSEISGGMARRVALARAIALDPELMMYDEPFAGLDPISLGITANLIRTLNSALGATSILGHARRAGIVRDRRLRVLHRERRRSRRRHAGPVARLDRSRRCASSSTARPTARSNFTIRATPLAADFGIGGKA